MTIRVVAGEFKRRTLKTPAGMSTRPTAGRVREALFSILGPLEGTRVLDLYAGSGALGIEALSRGAAHAVFVESERAALACIRDNLTGLAALPRATLVADRVERLNQPKLAALGPFDLVLCDPPWANVELAARAVGNLVAVFAPTARLVFEHPAGCGPLVPGLSKVDERSWGDTGISLWTPGSEAAPT